MSPARLFVNRMLASLRAADNKHVSLDSDFHRDLAWFRLSLETFNGIVVFRASQPVSHHIFVDSSLFAFGGVLDHQAYHLTLPDHLKQENISFLELLNIYVAICFWGDQIKGHHIMVHCDNMAAVNVLLHHRIHCPKMGAVARNIWSRLVALGIPLEVQHVAGCLNVEADALSRLSSVHHMAQFQQLHPELHLSVLDGSWCELNYNI